MVTRSVVQSAIHTAANALAHLPPDEWPGWVAYFCEALEKAAEGQEYESYDPDYVMERIVAILESRLDHGSW